jgi:hypothetical protein
VYKDAQGEKVVVLRGGAMCAGRDGASVLVRPQPQLGLMRGVPCTPWKVLGWMLAVVARAPVRIHRRNLEPDALRHLDAATLAHHLIWPISARTRGVLYPSAQAKHLGGGMFAFEKGGGEPLGPTQLRVKECRVKSTTWLLWLNSRGYPEYICVMGRQADALPAALRGNHYTYKPSICSFK